MATKGSSLEEVTREYFRQQGYFAVRGVPYRAYGNDVTDLDVFLYRRVGATHSRILVDVKSKRSPRAFERVLWTRGLKESLGFEGGIVATTDGTDAATRFAGDHGIGLVTRSALEAPSVTEANLKRLSLEDFIAKLREYEDQKNDGDWIGRYADAKTSLVSNPGFPAFNKATLHFRFFAERVFTRPQQKQIALRMTIALAALSCIALDQALEATQFASDSVREISIYQGIVYGDNNSGRTRAMIQRVLTLVAASIDGGDIIKNRIEASLEKQFDNIRADVIAEYFSANSRRAELVDIAIELDAMAFAHSEPNIGQLPASSKALLGVMADFTGIPRSHIFKSADSGQRNTDDGRPEEPKLI